MREESIGRIAKDFLGHEGFQLTEWGGGNLNYLYRVDSAKESYILKYAPPYIRCLGEGYPLSSERLRYEILGLKAANETIPEFAPKLFYVAKEGVVMEYLEGFKLLRQAFIQGEKIPHLAEHLAEMLARFLVKNSFWALNEGERKKLLEQSENSLMRRLSEDYIFTFPFMEHPTNQKNPTSAPSVREIYQDKEWLGAILWLKSRFSTAKEGLLHGDLHTGSLMIKGEQIKMIDFEFSFVGPLSFDLGAILANWLIAYRTHKERGEVGGYSQWLREEMEEFIERFKERFEFWAGEHGAPQIGTKGYLEALLIEAWGMAGVKIARRILGAAGVEDITSLESPLKEEAERRLLVLSREMTLRAALGIIPEQKGGREAYSWLF